MPLRAGSTLTARAPARDPAASPATIIHTAVSTHLRWLTAMRG